MRDEPKYGNWIRSRKLLVLWVLAGVFLALVGFYALSPWFLASLLPGLIFLYTSLIVSLTRHRFSRRGGGYQDRIHELILRYKKGPGDTLDVGCGSGHLIIAAAKADRSSNHVGLDYWGENWTYSRAQCETNARLEGVANVRFIHASAAATGIEDNRYMYVFSCLTFHEVRGQSDKTEVVRETLRTLKPGGTYVFLDLFDDRRSYPVPEALKAVVKQSDCGIQTNERLSDLMELPFPLSGKRALRYGRIISGSKGGE